MITYLNPNAINVLKEGLRIYRQGLSITLMEQM